MAQLLLIKTATSEKRIGDIVNIRDDTHVYSEYEKQLFNILQIMGTEEDIKTKLNASRFPNERVFKSSVGNKWSFTIEKKNVWQDRDEKWYFFESRPKFQWSLSGFVVEDITILETLSSGLVRDAILIKMVVNPGERDSANTVECKDLN